MQIIINLVLILLISACAYKITKIENMVSLHTDNLFIINSVLEKELAKDIVDLIEHNQGAEND